MDYDKQRRQRWLEWLRRFNIMFGIIILALITALIFGSPVVVREWPKTPFLERVLALLVGLIAVAVLIVAVLIWLSFKRKQKELKQETLKEGGVIE